jgi:hypothetical protein
MKPRRRPGPLRARIDDRDAAKMKQLRSLGISCRDIGTRFGISIIAVWKKTR